MKSVIKIQVKYIPVEYKMGKYGDFFCQHLDLDTDTICSIFTTFSDGAIYPDEHEEVIDRCTDCGDYYDRILEKWVEQW